MRRYVGYFVLMILIGALVTGCGSSAKQEMARGSAGDAADMSTRQSAASSPAPPAAPRPAEEKAGSGGNAGPVSSGSAPALDRKIIKHAEMEVKIKDADLAIKTISEAVAKAGGYVQETKQQGTKQQGRTTHMVMRIPSGNYENILSMVAELGQEVLSRREWTDDVTQEYLDVDARIKTQEVHLVQLNKLYEKGGSIKEMMELEQEIARVTSDLESLKGRFRFLSSQVEFSTITVRLFEPGAPTPIKPPGSVMERMKNGFTESWNGVVNFTGNLAVFVVSAVPVLVYLAAFGGLGYLGYRGLRKASRRPPSV